jgi:predicted transcriptional regulator
MPRPPSPQPTDGELEILRVLWQRSPLALSEIVALLRVHREVAPTTIATMLRVMRDKGLVERTGSGRTAAWRPAVSQASTARRMVRQLVARVFDGSAERLAAHLVEGGQLTAAQLADLRHLIDQQAAAAPEATSADSSSVSSPSPAPPAPARGTRP